MVLTFNQFCVCHVIRAKLQNLSMELHQGDETIEELQNFNYKFESRSS